VSAPPRALVAAAKLAAAIPAAPAFLILALVVRLDTERRRRSGARPRVLWGPEPLISIKYWSAALRRLGYPSLTLAGHVYPINTRSDFDRHRDEFGPPGLLFELFRDFQVFAWALRHADVMHFFFDGGYLRHTALDRFEIALLHLAGKRVVVSPYGSDVAVPGHLGPYEGAMQADYPLVAQRGSAVRARVDRVSRRADAIVRNVQPGYIPRWDVLWPNQLAIDLDEWSPTEREPIDEVVVLHAPNHRTLKGTDAVIRGCEALAVRLELLERRPNSEVRAALARADVLAEQLLAGYGMLAIEGLASGIAVISRTGWMPPELLAHPALQESPIVDADESTFAECLHELASDPDRRRTLARAGREYAHRWHSYEAVGRTWAQIFDAVWRGEPLPTRSEPLT
jgi:hypothetical protein